RLQQARSSSRCEAKGAGSDEGAGDAGHGVAHARRTAALLDDYSEAKFDAALRFMDRLAEELKLTAIELAQGGSLGGDCACLATGYRRPPALALSGREAVAATRHTTPPTSS